MLPRLPERKRETSHNLIDPHNLIWTRLVRSEVPHGLSDSDQRTST